MFWLAVETVAFSQSLEVTGTCPGPMEVAINGLTPYATFAVLTGVHGRTSTVPLGNCAGTPLDVGLPQPRIISMAGGDGVAHFSPSVPGAFCGKDVQILDLGSCTTTLPVTLTTRSYVGTLDGVSLDSTFDTGAQTALPAQGWTNTSGAAQVFGSAVNGSLIGATPYTNYGVQFDTGVAVQPNTTYHLHMDLGFAAGIAGGSAEYLAQLGTLSGGVFTQLGQETGSGVYVANLSNNVFSGVAHVTVTTGAAVSGDPLAVRFDQTSTMMLSDYFGIDNVTLTAAP
ncbi:MAG: hypothetical protein H6738_16455 [Alphaproteobacteria bacterium]|nr:hypothetical protein [Alphaproteobacteria bacterium]